MGTDVAEEKHEEPRCRKCGDEKHNGECKKFLDHLCTLAKVSAPLGLLDAWDTLSTWSNHCQIPMLPSAIIVARGQATETSCYATKRVSRHRCWKANTATAAVSPLVTTVIRQKNSLNWNSKKFSCGHGSGPVAKNTFPMKATTTCTTLVNVPSFLCATRKEKFAHSITFACIAVHN